MPPQGPRSVAFALALMTCALSGCSRKLSTGGGAMDVIFYDMLGMERSTAEYYAILRNAHDPSTFAIRHRDDNPFVADQAVDAIVHLGRATYSRLEGEAQVVLLLSDVLIEDPAALARDRSAASLALLGTRLLVPAGAGIPERGDRFLARLKELDSLHDADGRRLDPSPAGARRVGQIVEEIGRYDMPKLELDKDALRWFPTRAYIANETDPTLREIFDRAMVRRTRAVIDRSLEAAVADPVAYVRVSAVQGLKTVVYAAAVPTVQERLETESSPLVRGEIAEYLGAVGGVDAATTLVAMLRDDDGGVRLRAQRALVRIAGTDLGRDASAWSSWLAQGARRVEAPPASASRPVAPPPTAPRVVTGSPPPPPPFVTTTPPPTAPRVVPAPPPAAPRVVAVPPPAPETCPAPPSATVPAGAGPTSSGARSAAPPPNPPPAPGPTPPGALPPPVRRTR